MIGIERLAEQGPTGMEELSKIISEYFGCLVEVIVEHGGDIVKFAGDALLAIWPVSSGESLDITTHRAAQCALAVQTAMRAFASRATTQLELKVALGAGPLNCMHVGGVFGRWELLIAGDPFLQAGRAGDQAKPGDVVVSQEAMRILNDLGEGEPCEDGSFYLTALRREIDCVELEIPALTPSQSEMLFPYLPAAIRTRLDTANAGWIAELRRITILFVNLPGITHQTPIEDVQRMMRDLQSTLYKYEGSVNKLSVDDKGITFVAVLGLPPLAHEDDPLRGLQAAQGLRTYLKKLGLNTAIGVTTGRAYCGSVGSPRRCEYTIMGDVVNMAARLMQAAPDSILCDQATYDAVSNAIKFETLAPIKVKGKAEPVQVYRPADQPAPTTDRTRTSNIFIGRRAELAMLATQVNGLAKGGSGAVVIIEGDAGTGKSRLVEEVQNKAEEACLEYAVGAADSIERSTPYRAWRGVFSRLLSLDRVRDPQARRDHINELLAPVPALHRLAPLLNGILPLDLPEDGITAQMHGEVRADNMHELLLGILRIVAADAPLVVVIEDAHWKDSASWAFTRLAVRTLKKLLLVIATRPIPSPLPPEYAQIVAMPGTVKITLDMLLPEDAAALVSHRLGVRELSEEVTNLIHEKAGGNPFFTEELAYDLRDAGHLVIENGRCSLAPGSNALSISLPDTVEGVVSERIDRLTPDQQLSLKVASVIGRSFMERVLQNVHPLEEAKTKIDEHLNALRVVDLMSVGDQSNEKEYIFKHIITQQVAYNALLFSQRRDLHRSVAAWHEREYANDLAPYFPSLAHHYSLAEDETKAVDYLERAGTRALDSFANEEAISFFTQALALAEKSPGLAVASRRGFWNGQLGEAYYALGRQAESREHFAQALALLGYPPPGPVWRHLTSLLWQTLVQTVHRFFPSRFVRKPGAHSTVLLRAALANERLCQIYYIENAAIQSMNCAVTAVNLAETAGPSPELARSYGNVTVTTALVSAYSLSDMYERLASEMGTAVGHVASLAYAYETAGLYHAGAGHQEQAESRFAESITVAESIGDRRRWDEAKFLSAVLSQCHGRLTEARERFTDLYALGSRYGIVQVQLWGLTGRLSLSMATGGDAEAFGLLDALLTEHGDKTGAIARADAILAYGTIAQAHFRAGDIRNARLAAERVVRFMEESESISYYLLPGYQGLGETLTGLFAMRDGDGKAERKLVITMLAAFGRFALMYPAARPMNDLWRGVFARLEGRTARARRLFNKSVIRAERLGMPYAAALAGREIARLLPADAPERKARLAQVLDAFSQCGASRDVQTVDELLKPHPQ